MKNSNTAMGMPSKSSSCHFISSDADTLCRHFMAAVLAGGERRVYGDDVIYEVWGLSGVLENPRARLLTSSVHPRYFNPALAVARWLFMFSGSDRLADIAAYSPGAGRFTDDGITMPGGSHGSRIFYPVSGVNQIERLIAKISELGETTQGVVAVHHPTDLAQPTQDFVCVTSMLITQRGNCLHCMLHMRSNEALRLLWYDLFEFTMLGEYVSARLGLQLGTYLHSGFIFQISGEEDRRHAEEVAQEVEKSPCMPAMPRMTIEDRATVVNSERRLREASTHAARKDFLGGVRALTSFVDPYWADLLTAAALQARLVATTQERRDELLEDMRSIAPGPVTHHCLDYSHLLCSR